MKDKLEMGYWYPITARMIKRHSYGGDLPFDTTWDRIAYERPQFAMYIGSRTIFNGNFEEFHDPEYGNTEISWVSRQHHNVYLFVLNDRHNPVYVHPDDLLSTFGTIKERDS